MRRSGCTLAEAMEAASAAGMVMHPSGWLFLNDLEELALLAGALVWVTDYGRRREVVLPTGDRLMFVPADRNA